MTAIVSIRRSQRINSAYSRRSPRNASISPVTSHFFVKQSLKKKKKKSVPKDIIFKRLRTRHVIMKKAPVFSKRNNNMSKLRELCTFAMTSAGTITSTKIPSVRRSPRLASNYVRRSPRLAVMTC
jgi:hypothetical protein